MASKMDVIPLLDKLKRVVFDANLDLVKQNLVMTKKMVFQH